MADDGKTDETPETSEEPKAQWEYKKEFEINRRMKEVIKLAISSSEAEVAVLRRRLEKLTYGS